MVTISPRFLNAKPTIWVGDTLRICASSLDRDELVDADGLLLALDLGAARSASASSRDATTIDAAATRAGRHASRPSSWRCSRPPLPDRPRRACPSCGRGRGAPRRHRRPWWAGCRSAARHPPARRSSRRMGPPKPPGDADATGRGGNGRQPAETERGAGRPGVMGRGRGRSLPAEAGGRARRRRGPRRFGAWCRRGDVGRDRHLARGGARRPARRRRALRQRRAPRLRRRRVRQRLVRPARPPRRASAASRSARAARSAARAFSATSFAAASAAAASAAASAAACTSAALRRRRTGEDSADAESASVGAATGSGATAAVAAPRRRRAGAAGAACFSARTRFSRSQRARTRATWSSVSGAQMAAHGDVHRSEAVPITSSAEIPNSPAMSCTRSLLKPSSYAGSHGRADCPPSRESPSPAVGRRFRRPRSSSPAPPRRRARRHLVPRRI